MMEQPAVMIGLGLGLGILGGAVIGALRRNASRGIGVGAALGLPFGGMLYALALAW